jgi:serine/threonine protein kinase
LGKVLGEGEFGRVFEVLSFDQSHRYKQQDQQQQQQQDDDDNNDDDNNNSVSSSTSWPSSSLVVRPEQLQGVDDPTVRPITIAPKFGRFLDPTISSLQDDEDDDDDDDDKRLDDEDRRRLDDRRRCLVETAIRDGRPRYAVKIVRTDLPTDEKRFLAAMDMASELMFLSALSHPNVVRVYGVMGYIGRPHNFGIVMDRLYRNLREAIREWAKQQQQQRQHRRKRRLDNLFRRFNRALCSCRSTNAVVVPETGTTSSSPTRPDDDLFVERVRAVYDIVRAMR